MRIVFRHRLHETRIEANSAVVVDRNRAGVRTGGYREGIERRSVLRFQSISSLLLRSVRRPLKVSHQRAAYAHVEENASEDHRAASPSVLADQILDDRRKDESSDAGSAHGDSSGEASSLVEVISDDDDRRDVAQAQPDARNHTKSDEKHFHRVGRGRQEESNRRRDGTDDRHLPTSVAVRQVRRNWTRQQRRRHEDRSDPGGFAFRVAKVFEELHVVDAEGERDAVGDHVDHEAGEHHHPAPPAVRSLNLRKLVVLVGRAAAGAGAGDGRRWTLVLRHRLVGRVQRRRLRVVLVGIGIRVVKLYMMVGWIRRLPTQPFILRPSAIQRQRWSQVPRRAFYNRFQQRLHFLLVRMVHVVVVGRRDRLVVWRWLIARFLVLMLLMAT